MVAGLRLAGSARSRTRWSPGRPSNPRPSRSRAEPALGLIACLQDLPARQRRSSSCATCLPSRPPRSPPCSARAPWRSRARCSGPGAAGTVALLPRTSASPPNRGPGPAGGVRLGLPEATRPRWSGAAQGRRLEPVGALTWFSGRDTCMRYVRQILGAGRLADGGHGRHEPLPRRRTCAARQGAARVRPGRVTVTGTGIARHGFGDPGLVPRSVSRLFSDGRGARR